MSASFGHAGGDDPLTGATGSLGVALGCASLSVQGARSIRRDCEFN
jgi:hypothetical protein